jgi:carbamoyltransferase
MYILGISAYYHDSSACLIKEGKIIAAAQEERFTRKKGDPSFPIHAVKFCMEKAGIDFPMISWVVYYENPFAKFDRLIHTYTTEWPEGFSLFSGSFPVWARNQLDISKLIRRELGETFSGKVAYSNHHMSHAASAFFPSPFEEAAILTLDAVGEWGTSTIGHGEGNKIELLKELKFPHSAGLLYSAFTYYTGFRVNSGEYKLMGLAPYGKPLYADLIKDKIVTIHEDGSILLNLEYFDFVRGESMTSEAFHKLFGGPPRSPEERITKKDMDLAASIQKVIEEIVFKSAVYAHEITGSENLVLAGGVALNCVANGKLRRNKIFRDIWVQPAAGDAGGSLGAALLFWHQHLEHPRSASPDDSQSGSYLGPDFTAQEIETYLDSIGAVYTKHDSEEQLLDNVAERLAEGDVAGWFSGRMEFGPRALGARSIIGDARSPQMQLNMNLKIKNRESFRPFAPCVLAEYAHQYFDMEEGEESPYMLMVSPVRKEHIRTLSEEDQQTMESPDLTERVKVLRSSIPAVTHVDYSARVQTVSEKRNGSYYRLMKRFYEKTGCPVIVNTSFNIRGEPIVCSPEHAYTCFMATEMDLLVLGDYLLDKKDQPTGLIPELSLYKANMVPD